MPYPYADIAFTPNVKAVQTQHGSRDMLDQMEESARDFELGDDEAAFLAAQDHFFMATTSETGWPYVQHRGGPPGFVKVLDKRTFAFPDFRGNRQYISLGNLVADPRASFFFIDYPRKSRLKAFGHITVKAAADAPSVIEIFNRLGYKATIERVFVVDVAALDWNCPQHISPRFTASDVAPLTHKLEQMELEIAALKRELARK